jgi:two-component system nitrogen regulation response regulator GlnG
VIAATNQNLESLIESGRFRKDLYYRLRGVTISLPPLRDRREDVSELAHYFLFRYNRQLGASARSISPAALELLQQYDWPGNVRELQSIIREALIVSAGPTILPEFLPQDLRRETPADSVHVDASQWQQLPHQVDAWIAAGEKDLYRKALEHFDRLMLRNAMDRAEGHQAHAAEILGISRVTLRTKMRALGMQVGKVLTE